jgi:hypothetical protein
MNRINRRGVGPLAFVALLLLAPTIVLAIDSDGDGVDDAEDVCNTTPLGIAVDATGRPRADLDEDCDVDLHDAALFQQNMTGPFTTACRLHTDCGDGDRCTVDVCNVDTGVCEHPFIPGCGTCPTVGTCDDNLVCDVQYDGSIAIPIETDELCFCVEQGEIVHISLVELPGGGAQFNPQWRLVDGERNVAPSCGTFTTSQDVDCGPLPSAGNPYQIEIEDNARNDSGDYAVYFQRLSSDQACDHVDLECDVPLDGTIDTVAETDLIAFDASDNEIVSITVAEIVSSSGAAFNPWWRLLDALGRAAPACGSWTSTQTQICGPLDGATNPYRIEVLDGSRNDVGAYRVHLQRFPAATACEHAALPCDESIAGDTEDAVDTDLYSFVVSEGEILRVNVLEVVESGPQYNPNWRLLDRNGRPAAACGGFTGASGLDCGPLPSAGNPYRLEVADGAHNDNGSYLLYVQRLTLPWSCDVVPLPCGDVLQGTIDANQESDLFAFAAPEGEFVRVGVFEREPSGPSFNPWWRLLDASGRPAPACGAYTASTSLDCGPLPVSRGPYQVEVLDGSTNDTGSYQIFIDFLTSGCP